MEKKITKIDYANLSTEELKERIVNGVLPIYQPMSVEDYRNWVDENISQRALQKEVINFLDANVHTTSVANAALKIVYGLLHEFEYPNLSRLLSMQREYEFQLAGGGTGSFDRDKYDDVMYQKLELNLRYEHPSELIAGGYRFMIHKTPASYDLGSMSDSFDMGEDMRSEAWMELGRSFQNSILLKRKLVSFRDVKFGLGFVLSQFPETVGFFGKLTIYEGHRMIGSLTDILGYTQSNWTAPTGFRVKKNIKVEDDFTFDEIAKKLFVHVRKEFGLNIPPILLGYAAMTDKIAYTGSFTHHHFGGAVEAGMAIRVKDFYEVMMDNYVHPYTNGDIEIFRP
jgi:hypothetical protein